MSGERWCSFRLELRSLITTLGGTLWVDNSGMGMWDGGIEDNHVVVAKLPRSQMANLRVCVIRLGVKYQQQAIAILVGVPELIVCSANHAIPISAGRDQRS